LDGAGEQAQEHGRQGYHQGHEEGKHRHHQLIGKNVAEKTEGE
jgi:hypothetical protein